MIEKKAVLKAFLKDQLEVIEKIFKKIKTLEPVDETTTISLGYYLHNLYSAIEENFEQIARTFENTVEDKRKYHRELLRRMTLEIEGIRPKVISKETFKFLDELRAFRHLFRHAYDYELESKKIKELKEKVVNNFSKLKEDFKNFEKFLQES